MNRIQNLHTHTHWCDGADSPEAILDAAIGKGFESVGFSGHSWMDFAPEHSMSLSGTEKYKEEILRLKEEYAGRIGVFLGLEMEMYSPIVPEGYEYLIGSSHYFDFGGRKVGFDRSAKVVQQVIGDCFGGDGMKYAKEYYKNLARLPEYGDFDVIGHFDLITKHAENEDFFDTASDEYRDAAVTCAKALRGKIPYFEVNTGAIARGYRTTPYPDPFILKTMKELGFKAIISSDCHNRDALDCAFPLARRLLREAGFAQHHILTDAGFVPVPLEDE